MSRAVRNVNSTTRTIMVVSTAPSPTPAAATLSPSPLYKLLAGTATTVRIASHPPGDSSELDVGGAGYGEGDGCRAKNSGIRIGEAAGHDEALGGLANVVVVSGPRGTNIAECERKNGDSKAQRRMARCLLPSLEDEADEKDACGEVTPRTTAWLHERPTR
uniref:Uncharacterized protein n=1 Tax=Pyricularia oryzae (strain P131) TaxID=1143193 RepID=L7J0K8_PYRO1